jgi:hypothetical protein
MIKSSKEKKNVSLNEVEYESIPENIRNIIEKSGLFSKSTTWGKFGMGGPDEYGVIKIAGDDGGEERVFEYINMGIHYMMHGTEEMRPVFQVFVYFMGKFAR